MAVTVTTAPGIHLLNTNNSDRINWQRGSMVEIKDEAKAPLMAYYDKSGNQRSSQSDLIKLFSVDLMSRAYTLTDVTPGGTVAGNLGTSQAMTSTSGLIAGIVGLVHGGLASVRGT